MEENKNTKNHQNRPGGIPKKHVRGSSLLLSGRFLAMALNLLTQILIIRYLPKTDYGMFAYALTLLAMLTTMNRLGMILFIFGPTGKPTSGFGCRLA